MAVGLDNSVYVYDVHGTSKHEYVALGGYTILPIFISCRLRLPDVTPEEGPGTNPVHSVTFSPDGTLLAAASEDMKIRVRCDPRLSCISD